MCGIVGILQLDNKTVQEDRLKRMNRTMTHRGPDAEGYYFDGALGFGQRRLSIIDLSGGKQPLANEDRTVWVTFNGEIYNFLDLKKDLESKGHTFATHSDTEVLVHLYEEYGEKSVSLLQGMYAYAIWDSNKKELFIARDRIGIKPVYYYFDGNKFIFASEIKAILAYGSICHELDMTAVLDYLTFSFIPSPKSIFKHIKKLDAAHWMKISLQKPSLEIQEYWDISFAEKFSASQEEIEAMIRHELAASVKSHLISDVPLGAFLSGGIDSSAVVASMAQIISDPVKTCSIGLGDHTFTELPYAQEVAEQYKTDHHALVVEPEAMDIFDTLLYHYDEPFADTSALPSYYLSKIARQKVTVALSGDGGDENFAGYRRYIFDVFENKIRNIVPSWLRTPLFGMLGSLYPKADWLPQVFRAKTLFQNLAKEPFDAYFNTVSVYNETLLNTLLTDSFKQKLDGYSSRSVMKKYYDRADGCHYLDKVLYTEIKTFLPDDYLVKVDRASMANALEVRVPLLDHKFMEFTAKIPASMKLKGKEGKYIFKKALEPLLSHNTLYRKKRGFELPIDNWLRGELKERIEVSILAEDSFIQSIIKREYIEKIWNQHQAGVRNYGNNLWLIFFLESWHKKYICS